MCVALYILSFPAKQFLSFCTTTSNMCNHALAIELYEQRSFKHEMLGIADRNTVCECVLAPGGAH